MGVFSTIRVRARCAQCGALGDVEVQFEHGNLRCHEYGLGSELVWGEDQVGDPAEEAVPVDGIALRASCVLDMSFDVTVRGGRVCAAAVHDAAVDRHHGDGEQVALKP